MQCQKQTNRSKDAALRELQLSGQDAHAFTANSPGSIPAWRTEIPQATQQGQINTKTNKLCQGCYCGLFTQVHPAQHISKFQIPRKKACVSTNHTVQTPQSQKATLTDESGGKPLESKFPDASQVQLFKQAFQRIEV